MFSTNVQIELISPGCSGFEPNLINFSNSQCLRIRRWSVISSIVGGITSGEVSPSSGSKYLAMGFVVKDSMTDENYAECSSISSIHYVVIHKVYR